MVRLKFLLILVILYCLPVATINYFTYSSLRNYFVSNQGSHEHLNLKYGERCFCREGCEMMRSWETFQSHIIIGLLCLGAMVPVCMMSASTREQNYPPISFQ
ncbi:MAG: hypothetical protein QM703_15490 [Gemmatales bacterium]